MYSKIRIYLMFACIGITNLALAQDDFSDELSENTEQILTISGTVIDASTGKPIAGANIVVDDTELGAVLTKMVNLQLKMFNLVRESLHQQLVMMM